MSDLQVWSVLRYLLGLLGCFLLWTLAIYWLHRWSHIHHRLNPLWWIHRAHHAEPYLRQDSRPSWPHWGQYLFWLGGVRLSLDVILVMTLPLLLITWIWPQFGIPLLVFHYFYEVFLSESVLDHNPRVTGRWTHWFAWGDFHLHHHVHLQRNFGLLVCCWDWLFGTSEHPKPGASLERINARLKRLAAAQALVRNSTGSGRGRPIDAGGQHESPAQPL
ncbi:MAG: sterol desaturase family protein [Lysobacterales bacterium]